MKKSLWAFIVCGCFLFGATYSTQKWKESGVHATINWDGFGYYFYLPAFFYDEINVLNKYDYIQNNYAPTGGNNLNVKKHSNGNFIMRYPMGNALMFLPAFIVAHFWALNSAYPADGFSFPYQFCINHWGIFFSLFGLWIIRKVLLRYFSDLSVAVALIVLCFASNYFNYVSFSNTLTHCYLFTLYALIVYLTDSFYGNNNKKYWKVAVVGALCGLATITRPTEIISSLIPLLWGISDVNSARARLQFLLNNKTAVVLFAFFAVLFALPQLCYWKYYSGHWLYYSYEEDQTFSFLHPHIIDFLFSYKKGWFTYTPVMYLAVIGFIPLYKIHRQHFWSVFIFSLINLYIIASWDCWWYGGSFSQRAIVQSYALLMFPLTQIIEVAYRQRRLLIILFLVIGFCTWMNLLMTWQANSKTGIMESDRMTKAYFWRIFGKTQIQKTDRKLLDTNEELPVRLESSLSLIARLDFEDFRGNDSLWFYEGGKSLKLSDEIQRFSTTILDSSTVTANWYRVRFKYYYPEMEWNVWRSTQFTISLINNDRVVKSNMVRLHQYYAPNTWLDMWLDIKVPENGVSKQIGIAFWNADSQKVVYVDKLELYKAPFAQ